MLSTLCVCKIRAIILVNSETEPTFKGANMVFEEIGVLVEVDSFEGKLS